MTNEANTVSEAAKPIVSVIVPTRDRAAMLADTLRGLEDQEFPPDQFEVFVMDNLSKDNTRKLVEEFALRVPFTLHYHFVDDQGGPAPARNLAASLAQGDILAFTDSDCRPCPKWLASGVAALNGDVVMVSGPVIYKPEQTGNFFARRTGESYVEHPTYPTANIMYRKDVFHAHGGFDNSLCLVDPLGRVLECADTDLAWRILKSGHRNVFVEDMIVYHELEAQSPLRWLLEPIRLYCVPAVIRQHPELRAKLLFKGLFFYRNSLFYYAALAIALIVLMVDWRWLLAAPILLILRALMRAPKPSPTAWARSFMEVCLNIARNYVLISTLVYASIRFRTLVL